MKQEVSPKKAKLAPEGIGSPRGNGDLRESYEFNRTLLQSAPYPILVTGLDTAIRYVNPAFEALSGYTSDELLGRKSPYPWWPPDKIAEYELANVNGRTKEINKLDRYYRKKNGELFWVVLHIAPVRYEGILRYYIANWVDFTERKRAQEEVDRLQQIMAHVSRVNTLGEIATSLAHELNQPLAAIMANAGTALRMMRSGNVNIEEIKGILEDITADDRRAGAIIRRMREPLKRSELTMEMLDINHLIGDICTLVRNDAAIGGVTLDLQQARDLPLIRGDRTQLQQVLLNLMVNALDSVKKVTGGQRRIEVRSLAGSDHFVRVEVSDSGPGISESVREHLFEPLHTTKPDGLGVGLSISKNLIEAHGGRIWHENRAGGGAKFTFSLPIQDKAQVVS